MNAPKPRYWLGSEPTHCQVCEGPFHNKFVDGATFTGQWALMCKPCHKRMGRGLGMGRGQEYTRQADGRWLKTGG